MDVTADEHPAGPDADAAAAAPPQPDVAPRRPARRHLRWRAVIGLASIAGLAVAAVSTVDDAREQALPGAAPLAAALVLQVVAMVFAARGWATVFPPDVDRRAVVRGLYTSQLTKYLPAGGFVQAASQVALSSRDTGIAVAAMRLPVFATCSVAAAATAGAALAVAGDLAPWARVAAGLGLGLLLLLDRRLLARALGMARRVVRRLPPPDALPDQRSILRCYGYVLVGQIAYAVAFAALLNDLAQVDDVAAAAAFSAGWGLGYLALPLPSGVLVREGVLIATLPGLATGSLLAASVAHRLTGFLAEALLAGRAHAGALGRRRDRGPADVGPPATRPAPSPPEGPPRRSDTLS
jgi:hypothetical protein